MLWQWVNRPEEESKLAACYSEGHSWTWLEQSVGSSGAHRSSGGIPRSCLRPSGCNS